MAYNPISGAAIQYSKSNGQVADGYYLKFYIANTTTPLSMATDATGASTLVKCKLNDKGYPISNELDNDSVFIPHVDQSYRFVLYKTEADADGNVTANADVNIPSIAPMAGSETLGTAAYVDTGTAAGEVPLNSDLGTAAYVDTGTAAGEVPLNSDLGTAAYLDAGTGAADVPTNADGSGLDQLNASNLSSGTVPDARISETLSESQAYRQGNILGTVSESAGVPTGAVIERGSNANGEYVKFADGTLKTKTTVSNQAMASNGLADFNVTLPATHVNTDFDVSASGGPQSSTDVYGYISFSPLSTSEVEIRYRNGATAQNLGGIVVVTDGRWF